MKDRSAAVHVESEDVPTARARGATRNKATSSKNRPGRTPICGKDAEENALADEPAKPTSPVAVDSSDAAVDRCGSVSARNRAGDAITNKRSKVVDIPPPAPSVGLFSKFQERRGDFSSDWMLLQEENAANQPSEPPIAAELVMKLRERQAQMQISRDEVTLKTTGSSAVKNRDEGRLEALNEELRKQGADDGKSDSDVEYVPQEDTRGYRSLKQQGGEEPTVVGSAVAAPSTNSDEAEKGFLDDFLGFSKGDSEKNADSRYAVQATVTLKNGKCVLASDEVSSGQGGYDPGHSYLGEETRSVPLWCVGRLTGQKEYAKDAAIALHQEICDFVEFHQPTEAEIAIRCLVEAEVVIIAKQLWPKCEPVVFGSMATGLLLPLSDVDITILNVDVPTEEALRLLAREISLSGICNTAYPQLVLKAKVPLLKFQHCGSLLDVDISINARDGPRNTLIVIDLLKHYREAEPLIVVVKYFLHQRGMDEPYHGGLGSFALTLMAISFLQQHPIYTGSPDQRLYCGLGRLLVDFFRYYGMYFRYDRCGLSVVGTGRCFKRTDVCASSVRPMTNGANSSLGRGGPQSGPPQVLLEDPGCPENNAASSLRNFNVIATSFTHAFRALTAVFEPNRRPGSSSPDALHIDQRPTLLSRILHVDGESVKRRQAIIEAHGSLLQDPNGRLVLQQVVDEHKQRRERMLENVSLLSCPPTSDRLVSHKRPREDSNEDKFSKSRRGDSCSSNDSSVRTAWSLTRR